MVSERACVHQAVNQIGQDLLWNDDASGTDLYDHMRQTQHTVKLGTFAHLHDMLCIYLAAKLVAGEGAQVESVSLVPAAQGRHGAEGQEVEAEGRGMGQGQRAGAEGRDRSRS